MSLADIRNKIFHENNIDVGISTISEILKESEKWKQVEKNIFEVFLVVRINEGWLYTDFESKNSLSAFITYP